MARAEGWTVAGSFSRAGKDELIPPLIFFYFLLFFFVFRFISVDFLFPTFFFVCICGAMVNYRSLLVANKDTFIVSLLINT